MDRKKHRIKSCIYETHPAMLRDKEKRREILHPTRTSHEKQKETPAQRTVVVEEEEEEEEEEGVDNSDVALMTEEEADAEIERLNQNITLTLQAIDENFSKCNQIVSGSIIPEVDKISEASSAVLKGNEIWRFFFRHIQNTSLSGTNRPPLSHDSSNFIDKDTLSDVTSITDGFRSITRSIVGTNGVYHSMVPSLERSDHRKRRRSFDNELGSRLSRTLGTDLDMSYSVSGDPHYRQPNEDMFTSSVNITGNITGNTMEYYREYHQECAGE
ncbi:DASH complex subunit Ask1-domain-containing protein [Spinellus fusiger]|nr:DASH complex subunit Ask1-domain-containing protein [Spinellus fusiger]